MDYLHAKYNLNKACIRVLRGPRPQQLWGTKMSEWKIKSFEFQVLFQHALQLIFW